MTRNEKRVLFVLVEGASEMISLKSSFEAAFPNRRVLVEPFRGDITTNRFTTVDNIEERIYEEMYRRLRQQCLDFEDVAEVIHIVDTDGAYIEDRKVVSDDSRQHPYYDADRGEIRTRNKIGIERRNRQKREVVDCLVECEDLFGTPYTVFYMSCNLDHVLHGNPNTSNDSKTRKAKRFALDYGTDLAKFVKLISESDFSVTGDFFDSWDHMRFDDYGLNSIRKLTNLGIAFEHVR